MCLAATVAADVAAVRRELLPWMQYHAALGASRFYVSVSRLALKLARRSCQGPTPCDSHGPPHMLPPCLQLLYDGQDAEAVRLLGTLRRVTLVHIHPPFASAAASAKFRLYQGAASSTASRQWGGQPGNFELMVKQG